MDQRDRRLGMALVASAGVSFGTLPLFATWLSQAGVGVWAQVLVRLAVSVFLFFLALAVWGREHIKLATARQLRFVMLNGLMVVSVLTAYVFSIALGTPPAKTILLMYLFPIYVVLLGPRLLGERITLRRGLGVALGVLGTVVMLQVWAIRDVGQVHVGDLFALASGVVYAGVMILGRRGSMREGIHPLALNAWSFTFGLLWLLLAGGGALLMGYGASTFMRVPGHITPRTLADFLGIATLGTAVPYGLMFAGLKRLEATTVSVLSLIEPISVLVMSMLFLHQTPDIWQMVGGAVILAAGALVVR